MQKLFVQEIRFKKDDGSDFPERENKILHQIADKTSSNIAANGLDENSGEYKIYGATGFLQNVKFYTEEEEYISIVKDGAGVGRVLLCDAFSSVLGTLDIIKPKGKNDVRFLYELLQKMRFEKYVSGSTMPHIYFKDYSRIKIKVPHPNEQKKISSFAQKLDVRVEMIKNLLDDTILMKQSLLQEMFV